MGNSFKGGLCGIIAAITYGTNPLFSLNLYSIGMDVESVLLYRFGLAAIVWGIILTLRGKSLAVNLRQLPPLFLSGVFFAMSSQALYQSFLYMDAGIACSILFVYPIMVAVIMTIFFHEKASLLTYGCIAIALSGIALLYQGDGDTSLSTTGMLLVFISALCYSLYIVGVDHSNLSTVPSDKMTFWVLASCGLTFFALTGFGYNLHPLESSATCIVNVLGVALIPTIIPILFINIAIKNIGPTYSAIIGALEPVTALVIGVSVFHEQLTVRIGIGALLILSAVTLIVSRPLLVRHKRSIRNK